MKAPILTVALAALSLFLTTPASATSSPCTADTWENYLSRSCSVAGVDFLFGGSANGSGDLPAMFLTPVNLTDPMGTWVGFTVTGPDNYTSADAATHFWDPDVLAAGGNLQLNFSMPGSVITAVRADQFVGSAASASDWRANSMFSVSAGYTSTGQFWFDQGSSALGDDPSHYYYDFGDGTPSGYQGGNFVDASQTAFEHMLGSPVTAENMSMVVDADLSAPTGAEGDASVSFQRATMLFHTSTVTPEPMSLLLLATGLLGVGAARRRSRDNRSAPA